MNQRQELRSRNIQLKRTLGQNFLEDPNLCAKLVRAADVKSGERVLEIGPGFGALTEALLAAGARVLAVEIDTRFLPVLAERFAGAAELTVIRADFLHMDDASLEEFAGGERAKIVANLPYSVSSPILFRLLDLRRCFSLAVLTLQQEIVDRMAAEPGTKDRGVLSLRLQALTQVRPLFGLPAQVFFPQPQVDSRAVLLEFGRPRLPEDIPETHYAKVVRAGFAQRRKMLSNALLTAFDRERVAAALDAAGIAPTSRAEQLSLDDFFRLARALAVPT